jgi:thiamine biosynthesis lipoprotein
VEAGEQRFSRFLEDSELCELNRSAGEWFPASPDLFAVVGLAQSAFHQTCGLFDPSILPDLQRAGYDRSMDLIRAQGAGPLLETLLAGERPSFSEVELDERGRRILLPGTMTIDLGGIAKGWIAEGAALVLARFAGACAVNAGGDMFLVGLPEGLTGWPVGLEDPLHPEVPLSTLQVRPGGLATSTVTKRTWKQGERPRHHLIDPRTGEPAVTDWLSVTVTAAHAYEAEVFAKALLISGSRESEAIARNSGIRFSYLGVDRDGRLWGKTESLEQIHVH